MATRLYYLDVTTTWDRPELRGSTYSFKPQKHQSTTDRFFVGESQARAVARFNEYASGGMDSGSEYISRVALISVNLDNQDRRTVRKDVYRVRDAGADLPVTVATEAEHFERRMAAREAA